MSKGNIVETARSNCGQGLKKQMLSVSRKQSRGLMCHTLQHTWHYYLVAFTILKKKAVTEQSFFPFWFLPTSAKFNI